jgi:hypothetical protein
LAEVMFSLSLAEDERKSIMEWLVTSKTRKEIKFNEHTTREKNSLMIFFEEKAIYIKKRCIFIQTLVTVPQELCKICGLWYDDSL